LFGAEIFVVSTLAIDAVECTEFTVSRKQVDSEGYAKSAAMDGAEYRGRINNG
jgi:hypothetical protein